MRLRKVGASIGKGHERLIKMKELRSAPLGLWQNVSHVILSKVFVAIFYRKILLPLCCGSSVRVSIVTFVVFFSTYLFLFVCDDVHAVCNGVLAINGGLECKNKSL